MSSFIRFTSLLLLSFAIAAPAQQQSSANIIRVCVPPMANTSTRPINRNLQRDRLVRALQPNKKHKKSVALEAIGLNANTPSEIGREARDKSCDYVLYTELVELRTAGDPRRPNQGASISIGKDPMAQYPGPPYMNEPVFQATVDFRLNRAGDPEPMLSSSTRTLEHTDEDETVSRLLGQIASRVENEIGLDLKRPVK